MKKEDVIEILWKAIDNAFAFENYDGQKSEEDLTNSVISFADDVLSLLEVSEEEMEDAATEYILRERHIYRGKRIKPGDIFFHGAKWMQQRLKI